MSFESFGMTAKIRGNKEEKHPSISPLGQKWAWNSRRMKSITLYSPRKNTWLWGCRKCNTDYLNISSGNLFSAESSNTYSC